METIAAYTYDGGLYRAYTAEYLRPATAEEIKASDDGMEYNGSGIIEVDAGSV